VVNRVKPAARRLYACTWASFKPIRDRAGGAEGAILVAGSPRSGTTWVGAVVATMTHARSVFEPMLLRRDGDFALLRNRFVDEAALDRNYQLYIRPEAGMRAPRYAALEAILGGRTHGRWCDGNTRAGTYRRRVIKEVRANLFLAYLADTWPELRIVWLIRHPVDVIDSQIGRAAEGWQFDWYPDCVLNQPEAVDDWLAPFVPRMRQARCLWERLAHKWCIETFIPLKQQVQERSNVVFVRYEDLRQRSSAWDDISALVSDAAWDPIAFGEAAGRPSRATHRSAEALRRDSGRTRLDERACAGIEEIVKGYGLDSLYGGRSVS
jgi:hypothetical protein